MKTALAAATLALAGCATHPTMEPATSLAAAETAFAAHSVREDMRAAFLAAFADDGVVPRPDWTNSHAYLANRPAPAIVLDWRPAFVVASASGDLGLSTGPSKVTSKTKADAPPNFGQFVSVWRREGAGPWKVAVDLGISHPGDAQWKQPLEARIVPAPGGAGTTGGLAAIEARFNEASTREGQRAAYRASASEAFRLYRPSLPPPTDRATSLASPAMDDERVLWTVVRSEVSRAGDLGYARGTYALLKAPTEKVGAYLRVWQVERGEWRLLLDIVNPFPKPQPPPAS